MRNILFTPHLMSFTDHSNIADRQALLPNQLKTNIYWCSLMILIEFGKSIWIILNIKCAQWLPFTGWKPVIAIQFCYSLAQEHDDIQYSVQQPPTHCHVDIHPDPDTHTGEAVLLLRWSLVSLSSHTPFPVVFLCSPLLQFVNLCGSREQAELWSEVKV